MRHTRLTALLLTGGASLLTAGCASVAVEGAQAAKSEVVISRNIDEAKAGDAEAQYKVGNAYCCSVHEGSGLYNTKTSVDWLCRSAKQDYAPAMVKLGKIYSGDVIDGVRLSRRVAQGLAGSSTNLPVAWAWLQLAADRGQDDAEKRASGVWDDLNEDDQAHARQIYEQDLSAPCAWGDVIE